MIRYTTMVVLALLSSAASPSSAAQSLAVTDRNQPRQEGFAPDAKTGAYSGTDYDFPKAAILSRHEATPFVPGMPSTGKSPAIALLKHVFRWLGRFHVVVIHFPIALFLAAILAELWCAARGGRAPDPRGRFCVLLGAVSALPVVLLGWFHADFGGYGGDAEEGLRLHRWIGTIAGLWVVALLPLSEWEWRRQQRTWMFRTALGVGAILVLVTSHIGGTLVHGEGFFKW